MPRKKAEDVSETVGTDFKEVYRKVYESRAPPARRRWTSDISSAQRRVPSKRLKGTNAGCRNINPLMEISDVLLQEEGARSAPSGTNGILDYFGFPDGEEKNTLLKTSGGGEHHLGADHVKKAYDLALDIGLVGRYEDTPAETRTAFTAIAHSVYLIGKKSTGLIVRNFGAEGVMAMLVGNYAPFFLKEGICLVPGQDLEGLTRQFGKSRKLNHGMMELMGYQAQQINGLPPVYIRQQDRAV